MVGKSEWKFAVKSSPRRTPSRVTVEKTVPTDGEAAKAGKGKTRTASPPHKTSNFQRPLQFILSLLSGDPRPDACQGQPVVRDQEIASGPGCDMPRANRHFPSAPRR